MNEPIATIIIPAYNAERYLNRCINSVINQTLDNWELIIIDDGSTDHTYQIAISYSINDNRIKVLKKHNEGQGIARNLGIEHANGMFVGFMDADDYINEDMIRDLSEVANKYSADLVYSYMEGEKYFTLDGKKGNILIEQFDTQEKIDVFRRNLIGCLPEDEEDSKLGMSVCRSLFRNELLRKYKLRFISERKVNSEDLLFNLDFLTVCRKIVTINKRYYTYRHDNPQSFSIRPNRNRFNMFKNLNEEIVGRCMDNDEMIRAQRRFLANVRVTVVEKARWTTIKNYHDMYNEILKIVNDDYLRKVLLSYPVNKLPFKQAVYFRLMVTRNVFLLIAFAKLRYKFG